VVDNGKVTGKAEGTAVITAKAGEKTAECTVTVRGVLINGVVWALKNVDAPGTFAAKAEDFGMFYQWNRKIGWSSTNPMKNSNGGTNWDNTIVAGTTNWAKANDPSPSGWRVPTNEEMGKLFEANNVTNEWTTQGGVEGRKFTDKKNGYSIFLPAAGWRFSNGGDLQETSSRGRYWSGTPIYENDAHAYTFQSGGTGGRIETFRAEGLSIRPVLE
jgi:uncharacterized protein (TIGR02145 family)